MRVCPRCGAQYRGEVRLCASDSEVLVSREDDPLLGAQLGRFTLESLIAEGVTGRIYAAREAVVRVLYGDFSSRDLLVQRLRRDVDKAKQVHHPNIARPIDVGSDDGSVFVAYEKAEGTPLSRDIPAEQALSLARQLTAALAAIHDAGAAHRNLHPRNVLVDEAGTPRILDFGLGAVARAKAALRFRGTDDYAAPEAIRPTGATPAADVYALGKIISALVQAPPPELAELLTTMLAEDPANRPPNARVVLTRWEGAAAKKTGPSAEIDDLVEDWARTSVPVSGTVPVDDLSLEPPEEEEFLEEISPDEIESLEEVAPTLLSAADLGERAVGGVSELPGDGFHAKPAWPTADLVFPTRTDAQRDPTSVVRNGAGVPDRPHAFGRAETLIVRRRTILPQEPVKRASTLIDPPQDVEVDFDEAEIIGPSLARRILPIAAGVMIVAAVLAIALPRLTTDDAVSVAPVVVRAQEEPIELPEGDDPVEDLPAGEDPVPEVDPSPPEVEPPPPVETPPPPVEPPPPAVPEAEALPEGEEPAAIKPTKRKRRKKRRRRTRRAPPPPVRAPPPPEVAPPPPAKLEKGTLIEDPFAD